MPPPRTKVTYMVANKAQKKGLGMLNPRAEWGGLGGGGIDLKRRLDQP